MLNKISLEFSKRYENAEYTVLGSTPIKFKVGLASEPLKILLDSYGVKSACFITACNPHGKKQGDTLNAKAMELLKEQITARNLPFLDGYGKDPDSDWMERSYLVLGLDKYQAEEIGRVFNQNAVVLYFSGKQAELVWLENKE